MKYDIKCETCGKKFLAYKIRGKFRRFCTRECIDNTGKKNPMYKKGFSIGKNGYIYEQSKGHPLADKRCRVLKHRKVVYDFLGFIPKNFIIHHLDGNKLNNSLSNLAFISQSFHIQEHDPLFSRYGKKTQFKKNRIEPIPVISYSRALGILDRL